MCVKLDSSKWISSKNINISNKNNRLYMFINKDNDISSHTYINYINKSSLSIPSKDDIELLKPNKAYQIKFIGNKSNNLDIRLHINTYSENNLLSSNNLSINDNCIIYTKPNVIYTKVAIRVSGYGGVFIDDIVIEEISDDFILDSIIENIREDDSYLVLTNIYPSSNNLYRNGFVHRRVKLYKNNHLNVDVFVPRHKGCFLSKYKFDDIDVYNGDYDSLDILLKNKNYKKILIHFVNEDMINTIKKSAPNIPLIIWIHGFEAERWHRRKFNFTEREIKRNSPIWEYNDIHKMEFMKDLYSNLNYKFVFVSDWFLKEVAEVDADCKVKNFNIIPNVVDENIFKYTQKSANHRKKILIIRPFASKKYANDLSVKAILELSTKDFFYDLEFNIFGKGPLFNETILPLRNFPNINITEGFLTQEQISSIHKEHGIFLCPTRLDSQGVSMCEAMNSGLVPVTSNVSSIPEFVNESCGILADYDDYKGLANGIEYLYKNPNKFLELSKNSYEFIYDKCNSQKVIKDEISLILK